MNYPQAIGFLYGLRWFGTKLGLENTFKLAELAGNPQNKLRFIHVAGTNGKGSTCAMLESIYRVAGLRTGLFTSPHLVAFNERIQVNGQPVSEADVVRLVDKMKSLLKTGWHQPQAVAASFSLRDSGDSTGRNLKVAGAPERNRKRNLKVAATGATGEVAHPTFFEVVTIMALQYFAEQKCDTVIWETGLGGRLDSTNIVTPLASVITNIQYDHQRWLGETLSHIAAEKAGIIKPGLPTITGTDEPEALAVIQETALRQHSTLTLVTPAHTQHPPLDGLRLPLLGWHQRMNAAVALATVRALQRQIPASDAAIRQGLLTVQWPGRLQLVDRPSGQRVLLDAAHNSGGATSLRAALEEHFPHAKPTLILGILQDKDWDLMCEILAPLAGRILCSRVTSERSAEPDQLREACLRTNPEAEVTACASLADAIQLAAKDRFVVIAGSLYLIGEAMELLHVTATPSQNERGLNEWAQQPVQRQVLKS